MPPAPLPRATHPRPTHCSARLLHGKEEREGTSDYHSVTAGTTLHQARYQRPDVDAIVGVTVPDSGLCSPVSEEELVGCGIAEFGREGLQHCGGSLDGPRRPVQWQRWVGQLGRDKKGS